MRRAGQPGPLMGLDLAPPCGAPTTADEPSRGRRPAAAQPYVLSPPQGRERLVALPSPPARGSPEQLLREALREGSIASATSVVASLGERIDALQAETSLQLHRLDQRFAELREAPCTPQLAKLQGLVDGLAETVRGIVREADLPAELREARVRTDVLVQEMVAIGASVHELGDEVADLHERLGAVEAVRCTRCAGGSPAAAAEGWRMQLVSTLERVADALSHADGPEEAGAERSAAERRHEVKDMVLNLKPALERCAAEGALTETPSSPHRSDGILFDAVAKVRELEKQVSSLHTQVMVLDAHLHQRGRGDGWADDLACLSEQQEKLLLRVSGAERQAEIVGIDVEQFDGQLRRLVGCIGDLQSEAKHFAETRKLMVDLHRVVASTEAQNMQLRTVLEERPWERGEGAAEELQGLLTQVSGLTCSVDRVEDKVHSLENHWVQVVGALEGRRVAEVSAPRALRFCALEAGDLTAEAKDIATELAGGAAARPADPAAPRWRPAAGAASRPAYSRLPAECVSFCQR